MSVKLSIKNSKKYFRFKFRNKIIISLNKIISLTIISKTIKLNKTY